MQCLKKNLLFLIRKLGNLSRVWDNDLMQIGNQPEFHTLTDSDGLIWEILAF